MRKRRLLLPAVLAALLVAPPAQADDPLVTDPEGDAGRCTGFCTTPTLASDPAVDMLAADIDLRGQTLSFSIDVLDLDRISTDPTSPQGDDPVTYWFTFRSGPVSFTVAASRTYAHGSPAGTLSVHHYDGEDHNVHRAVPFAFDGTTDTVTIEVPLATLNDAIAEACATCAPVGRGTVFDWLGISAWIYTYVDTPLGAAPVGWSHVDNADTFGLTYTVD